MDESKYIQLLDEAYKQLPEVVYKKQRFEVPQVSGRIIKSRTVITNFREIAKHLGREESHFLRFMLKEVGVRGECNDKGDLTLHSRFQPAMLNKAVSSYFLKYVQCPHCNSPDTIITDENSILKCNACGHQEKITRI